MIYCFDIDGTICDTVDNDYEKSVPRRHFIARINALFDAGHTIKIFTARGATSGKYLRGFTVEQLASWGLKYHELIMGKPNADVFIDDKAMNIADWDLAISRKERRGYP